LEVDVSKNLSTAASSNDGEFDTSTTTARAGEDFGQALARERVDARVRRRRHRLMALLNEGGRRASTPMSPVPPMITIFMVSLLSASDRGCHHPIRNLLFRRAPKEREQLAALI